MHMEVCAVRIRCEILSNKILQSFQSTVRARNFNTSPEDSEVCNQQLQQLIDIERMIAVNRKTRKMVKPSKKHAAQL
jgi:hypothetical protein